MTESADRELAADIEAAVRVVPGVTAVFRAGGLLSKALVAGAQLLGIGDEEASLVRVVRAPDGIRVEVAIGVHSAAGAVATAHRVQAAIDALGAAHGASLAGVHVTVVHVDDTVERGASP